ncbi:MAG: 4-vinyl reductase [Pleurocapsa minor GSE-CHR-MK-17-07R]|jgi:predicted hydrocarbon binding protein|nr:4-vinyl reductase [Pleurocapsa minor GSE-CHR-MK 17-07R]
MTATPHSSDISARTSGSLMPDRFGRAFLLAMQEVMGEHSLQATLELAHLHRLLVNLPSEGLTRSLDFAIFSALNLALDEMYSARGGRGMALRAGRAWLARGMLQFGALAGMADPAFRTLPLDERLRVGMKALAAVMSHFSDQQCAIEDTPTSVRFIIHDSAMCWGQTAQRPVCHPYVGLLQETALYATNGREHTVREIQCVAAGADRCIFVINKHTVA